MNEGILFNNKILDIVFVACFSAQLLKTIIHLFLEKKLNFRKAIETGGMPSSHSSTVTSLATCMAIKYGFNSDYFAISMVLAMIVMYDAAGIRRQAGRQAEALNKIIENIKKKDGFEIIEKNLKEILGHTPREVIAGAIYGIIIGLIFKAYLLN